MEVDLVLLGIFELARDVGTRGHTYKLSILFVGRNSEEEPLESVW